MADKKISQLTASTTPLAGTEVLPIVQSGATVKVSVDNFTAGREVDMAGANSTDHLKVVAGKGLAYNLNTAVFMTPEDNIQGARIAAGGSFKLLVGAGNEAINVDATSRDVKATLGNFVIGTAGKGIDFSADPSAAGMTSELLDDYEEGTWTPALSDAEGNFFTMSIQVGRYIKIGSQVTLFCTASWTSKGSVGASILLVQGLPYTSSNTTNLNSAAAIGFMNGVDTSSKQIAVRNAPNSGLLLFYQLNDNAAPTELPSNAQSDSGEIQLSITYTV